MDRDSELKELSYHAAGDVVISYLLGYEIKDVQIGYTAREGRDYSASMEGPQNLYIDAITYAAGLISEQIFTDSKEEFDLKELSYDADVPITAEIMSTCKKLLMENWPAVEALASALLKERIMTGARAMEIIRGAQAADRLK